MVTFMIILFKANNTVCSTDKPFKIKCDQDKKLTSTRFNYSVSVHLTQQTPDHMSVWRRDFVVLLLNIL